MDANHSCYASIPQFARKVLRIMQDSISRVLVGDFVLGLEVTCSKYISNGTWWRRLGSLYDLNEL